MNANSRFLEAEIAASHGCASSDPMRRWLAADARGAIVPAAAHREA